MTKTEEQYLCEIRNELRILTGQYKNVRCNDSVPVSIQGNLVPVKLAKQNDRRNEVWLHNSSASALYIGLTNDISTDKYALRIATFDTLILNANNFRNLYKREIYGFWVSGASTTSKCMVSEFILEQ